MTGGICSELPGIANGGVTVLGGTQQELRFHCDPGFLLLGSSDLKCMPDNTYVMIIISLVAHSALKSEKECKLEKVALFLSKAKFNSL